MLDIPSRALASGCFIDLTNMNNSDKENVASNLSSFDCPESSMEKVLFHPSGHLAALIEGSAFVSIHSAVLRHWDPKQ